MTIVPAAAGAAAQARSAANTAALRNVPIIWPPCSTLRENSAAAGTLLSLEIDAALRRGDPLAPLEAGEEDAARAGRGREARGEGRVRRDAHHLDRKSTRL